VGESPQEILDWSPVMRVAPRALAAIAAVGGYVALYRLGLVSGSTPAERRSKLPGDQLIDRPSLAVRT